MERFTVTIVCKIKAASAEDARCVGIDAANHLYETFNDDNSISAAMSVTAEPAPAPKKRAPRVHNHR